jgi:sugar/nucleoside kinase (ribokinase family)
MKLLVVGHLCLDVIHPVEGPEVQSYGGITHAVATLASLAGKADTVVPVFGVHRGDYGDLMEHLAQFPNVETGGIFKTDEPTNTVHLYYKDRTTRVECSKNIARPIPYEKIRRHLSVDGILVNMISGFDIDLETLDHIRMAVRGHDIPIHFDYHSLTLGVRENAERFRRPVVDWRRWAFMTDTIQMNEEEMSGLTVERSTEARTVGHLLTLSVKGVVVTRGERGATLYTSDRKHVVRREIPGIQIEPVVDPTGCGDIFGAAFFLHYVRTSDMAGAAAYANGIAAATVRSSGIQSLQALKDVTIPV